MERVESAAFGPEDRIGQLTMRNLDIADSRNRLEQYVAQGLVGGATGELVAGIQPGGFQEIAGHRDPEVSVEALDAAAMEYGAD